MIGLLMFYLGCPAPGALPTTPPPSANLPLTPLAPTLPGPDGSATVAATLADALTASQRLAPPPR